jgi:hypothetical protein
MRSDPVDIRRRERFGRTGRGASRRARYYGRRAPEGVRVKNRIDLPQPATPQIFLEARSPAYGKWGECRRVSAAGVRRCIRALYPKVIGRSVDGHPEALERLFAAVPPLATPRRVAA